MTRFESKYFNTAALMDEALLSLLPKKEYEFITVKEICQKAGVNRSTFYLHYETIDDLLKESIDYLVKDFMAGFQDQVKDPKSFIASISTCPKEKLLLINTDYLIPYLTFIKNRKEVFALSIEKTNLLGSMDIYTSLKKYVLEPILDRFGCQGTMRKYILPFCLSGISGLVMEWIKNGCKEEVDEMAECIQSLIIKYDETER